MTSEVCVMNRHAAVLAADSASTMTRWDGQNTETRYFKGANKIFQISHRQPVGVMIFDSADLFRVPWEIVLKEFRDHLSDRSFPTLTGYADEFFAFLNDNQALFPTSVQREELVEASRRAAIDVLSAAELPVKVLEAAEQQKLHDTISHLDRDLGQLPFAPGLTPEHVTAAIATEAEGLRAWFDGSLGLPEELSVALARVAIIAVYKRSEGYFSTAGLVFAGFGDHDIFPSMVEFQSAGILSGVVVTSRRKASAITHDIPASMDAFAQTSMSDTFSVGFSGDVYALLIDSLVENLKTFASKVCDVLDAPAERRPPLDELISKTAGSISDGWFQRAHQEHAYPLRRVLGWLPVDEMAELAETLVTLQSLKEKVTKPSTSVGGPVDVAIITKHEGFIWKKRKLFFDAELNPRYFMRQQALHR